MWSYYSISPHRGLLSTSVCTPLLQPLASARACSSSVVTFRLPMTVIEGTVGPSKIVERWGWRQERERLEGTLYEREFRSWQARTRIESILSSVGGKVKREFSKGGKRTSKADHKSVERTPPSVAYFRSWFGRKTRRRTPGRVNGTIEARASRKVRRGERR